VIVDEIHLMNDVERGPTVEILITILKKLLKNMQLIALSATIGNPDELAEWLDADFKVKDKKLYINYNHVLDSNGNLIYKNSEVLDKATLMEDKTPGISLEDYLTNNNTKQGLPSKNVKSGDFYYWFPGDDNNSVARFDADSGGAGLDGDRDPSSVRDSSLGVFAVKDKL